jgi:hypothetical protein
MYFFIQNEVFIINEEVQYFFISDEDVLHKYSTYILQYLYTVSSSEI